MTKKLFAALAIYRDISSRSASMNMAIDEALLETAKIPSIRFYQWNHPALSFGYFCKFADVADHRHERDLVRRWTGGGIVLHGADLTYAIVIPACNSGFRETSRTIYERVHRALANALAVSGQAAELVTAAAVADRRDQSNSAVIDRLYSDCFANPVPADVLVDGRKIAGAAQRRTRSGLLQQGSIQNVPLEHDFMDRFAKGLAADCSEWKIDDLILERAQVLAQQKYATDPWLQRR
jgi:lipoate-protein ligase A